MNSENIVKCMNVYVMSLGLLYFGHAPIVLASCANDLGTMAVEAVCSGKACGLSDSGIFSEGEESWALFTLDLAPADIPEFFNPNSEKLSKGKLFASLRAQNILVLDGLIATTWNSKSNQLLASFPVKGNREKFSKLVSVLPSSVHSQVHLVPIREREPKIPRSNIDQLVSADDLKSTKAMVESMLVTQQVILVNHSRSGNFSVIIPQSWYESIPKKLRPSMHGDFDFSDLNRVEPISGIYSLESLVQPAIIMGASDFSALQKSISTYIPAAGMDIPEAFWSEIIALDKKITAVLAPPPPTSDSEQVVLRIDPAMAPEVRQNNGTASAASASESTGVSREASSASAPPNSYSRGIIDPEWEGKKIIFPASWTARHIFGPLEPTYKDAVSSGNAFLRHFKQKVDIGIVVSPEGLKNEETARSIRDLLIRAYHIKESDLPDSLNPLKVRLRILSGESVGDEFESDGPSIAMSIGQLLDIASAKFLPLVMRSYDKKRELYYFSLKKPEKLIERSEAAAPFQQSSGVGSSNNGAGQKIHSLVETGPGSEDVGTSTDSGQGANADKEDAASVENGSETEKPSQAAVAISPLLEAIDAFGQHLSLIQAGMPTVFSDEKAQLILDGLDGKNEEFSADVIRDFLADIQNLSRVQRFNLSGLSLRLLNRIHPGLAPSGALSGDTYGSQIGVRGEEDSSKAEGLDTNQDKADGDSRSSLWSEIRVEGADFTISPKRSRELNFALDQLHEEKLDFHFLSNLSFHPEALKELMAESRADIKAILKAINHEGTLGANRDTHSSSVPNIYTKIVLQSFSVVFSMKDGRKIIFAIWPATWVDRASKYVAKITARNIDISDQRPNGRVRFEE